MPKIVVSQPHSATLFQATGPGALDFVPVTPGTDVLPDTLGWWPRGVRANVDGTLVVRFIESEEDRTLTVAAGEILLGHVAQVLAGTTCDPFLIR